MALKQPTTANNQNVNPYVP